LDPTYSYLLFFGFIRDYKGLDLLLKAFADERFRSQKLKLIVAGEFYTDSKPYYELIDQLHLKDVMIMHNEFIPTAAFQIILCCGYCCSPYKSATQSGLPRLLIILINP